jgi:hypothetical protein
MTEAHAGLTGPAGTRADHAGGDTVASGRHTHGIQAHGPRPASIDTVESWEGRGHRPRWAHAQNRVMTA